MEFFFDFFFYRKNIFFLISLSQHSLIFYSAKGIPRYINLMYFFLIFWLDFSFYLLTMTSHNLSCTDHQHTKKALRLAFSWFIECRLRKKSLYDCHFVSLSLSRKIVQTLSINSHTHTRKAGGTWLVKSGIDFSSHTKKSEKEPHCKIPQEIRTQKFPIPDMCTKAKIRHWEDSFSHLSLARTEKEWLTNKERRKKSSSDIERDEKCLFFSEGVRKSTKKSCRQTIHHVCICGSSTHKKEQKVNSRCDLGERPLLTLRLAHEDNRSLPS